MASEPVKLPQDSIIADKELPGPMDDDSTGDHIESDGSDTDLADVDPDRIEPDTTTAPETSKRKAAAKPVEMNSLVRGLYPATEEELKLEEVMVEMGLFTCRACGMDLKCFLDLRDHVKAHHDPRTYQMCCDQILRTALPLYDHIRLHVDKDAFKCKDCGNHLQNSMSLKMHKKKFHSKGPPTHICEHCGKGFSTKHTYDNHMINHSDKVACKYCGKEYSSRFSLKTHITTQHELEVNYLCELCGKGFSGKGLLTSHIKDHGGPHGGKRRKKPKLPSFSVPVEYDESYFKK